MIYSARTNGKEHGTVFTRKEIVNYILDSVGLISENNILTKTILDPAVGEGAFILPIIEQLIKFYFNDKKKLKQCLKNITVYEIDKEKIEIFLKNVRMLLKANHVTGYENHINIYNTDYLLSDYDKYDIIIGNPPYIRYDNIPKEKIEYYKRLFSCFKYRCDIYICFFEKCLKSLKANGILSFICSDRWLNNQYGKILRLLIKENFSYKEIIKIKNFNPFNENVIAYPAIFTISNSKQSRINYYTADSIKSLTADKISSLSTKVNINNNGEITISDIPKNHCTIEGQGFKIGIGVASGSDKVFIVNKNTVNIEEEVLIPIITQKDIYNENIIWENNYIINPYNKTTNKLLDLNNYPLLKKYFDKNKNILMDRYISRKNKNNWYKTIDKIDINLINKPKLLIPDISKKNSIYYDSGKYYPHHNFYYIIGNSVTDLLVLMAFLSTDYIKQQVEEKCTLMNGGALRRQAQTLRKLLIPNISLLDNEKKYEIIYSYKYNIKERIEIIIKNMVT